MIGEQRDRFGGCPAFRFEPAGFFRLEKTPERFWLVTPEGNAFLSFGANHVMLDLVMADYSAPHWAGKFTVADFEDKKAFLPGFRAKVRKDAALCGWNTLGCHSPQIFYPESFMPYVCQMRCVDICHYMEPTEADFHDVFSPVFEAHCDARARAVASPRKDDPFLLGYSMSDCPIFTDLDAAPRENNIYGKKRIGLPTWPRVLRNLGAESPGKRAYVQTVRDLYRNDIQAFNGAYATAFDSFGALERASGWRPQVDRSNKTEERDNLAFLYKVVDRCYTVEKAAIRRYDANHMIFGDKLNGNTDTPDEIFRLAAKHFDLIFYQYYAFWPDQKIFIDRIARLTGKPIFHGDSCYSVPNEKMPDPYGPHCADQAERVESFREAFDNAFARPDYLGWNWCGWMDSWEAKQPGKQHSGVQDPFGAFHPIQKEMAAFSQAMYKIAMNRPRA